MSPIEKAWDTCEKHLWVTETWSGQQQFEAALSRAWAAAITPAYCRNLFRGLRATWECVGRPTQAGGAGGGRVIGWGRHVKAA